MLAELRSGVGVHTRALGIRHYFDFSVAPRSGQQGDPADDQQSEPQAGAPTLSAGDPLLLNIVSDQSRLDVSGLDLDVLGAIVRNSQRQLQLTGIKDEPGGGADEGQRLAPPGATLRPTTDKPLSRAAAELLCELSDEPGWANEVWSFWARSHHLTVHRQLPFLTGTSTEPFDVPARVVVEKASPLDQQRLRTDAYRHWHPVGSVAECTVMRIANQSVFVELEIGHRRNDPGPGADVGGSPRTPDGWSPSASPSEPGSSTSTTHASR